MDKLQKQEQVKYITEKFAKAKAVIFADYRGLNVAQITKLRTKLSSSESTMKVVKNRLVKRAAKDANIVGLDDFLVGPTAMTVSEKDPVVPAKILVEFAKEYEVLKIKVGYMDGKVLDLNTIKALASLPSREVLLSRMLSSMNAPATNLAMVLSAIPRQLVTVMDAIRKTKEK